MYSLVIILLVSTLVFSLSIVMASEQITDQMRDSSEDSRQLPENVDLENNTEKWVIAGSQTPSCDKVKYTRVDGNIQISSGKKLYCIGQSSDASVNDSYELTANIDMSNSKYWSGSFEPIASEDTPFNGDFEGNKYTIHGVVVDRPCSDRIGLFDTIGSDGRVTNISVNSMNMVGRNSVGTLFGSSKGTISNYMIEVTDSSYVSGTKYTAGTGSQMNGVMDNGVIYKDDGRLNFDFVNTVSNCRR